MEQEITFKEEDYSDPKPEDMEPIEIKVNWLNKEEEDKKQKD